MSDELEKRVRQLEQTVAENRQKIQQLTDSGTAVDRDGRKTSLAEFKNNFSPSTHAEKAVIVGYYLEQHEEYESFTARDLIDGFRKCRWRTPANMSDILGKAAGNHGYFMEVGEEDNTKQWMLTETGLNHIEERISEE